MPVVVNFYGGPGSGKSTWAAYFFSHLKQTGLKVELVTEFAKDMTYDGRQSELNHNWPLVLGEQFSRMFRLRDQVDVIITDSPLLLSAVYADVGNRRALKYEINRMKEHSGLDNEVDVMVARTKKYESYGRNQTEFQAKELDDDMKELLITVEHLTVTSQPDQSVAGMIHRLVHWRMHHNEQKSMETKERPQNS